MQRPVYVGLTEEQRNADQDQEQARWETSRHVGSFHSSKTHPDDECKGDREKPNIDF